MLFEILIAVIIGIFLGCFTGLTPGIHINLVSLLILSSSPFLLKFTSPLILSILIISMAITHTFLDAIPSVFLGAPDAEQVLSVLPGHRLLLEGKGYEAVSLLTIGSLISLILIAALTPLMLFYVKYFYSIIQKYIGYLLILACLVLILKESRQKFFAFFIFILSGILGLTVFNLNLEDPLFPLLSGLFGISGLLLSINDKVKIPYQFQIFPRIEKSLAAKAILTSVFSSGLCSFLPGLGPSQAAILGSSFTKNLGDKGYLILNGGMNTVNMFISIIALFTIEKARNGAIVIVSKIIQTLTLQNLIIFVAVSLVASGLASILTLFFAKKFSKLISKINYRLLCLSIILLIVILSFVFSGFLGFFVLVISTSVGLIPALKGFGRNHLMGCLLLPVILYFML
ncbi:MAG TPA: tripartite tricarboxylate transporter permease [Candidatus Nanoarchaeia archaeon]|nr:tripartite tricarboxylate transporter permease [Candidatus Nanoarchaeia archaeon]